MISLNTIPVEFVYRILDELDDFDVLCSMRNVCIRLDKIIENYPRYQTLKTCEISGEKLHNLPAKNIVYAMQNNTVIENIDSIISYVSPFLFLSRLQITTTLELRHPWSLNEDYDFSENLSIQYLSQSLKTNSVCSSN